MSASAATALSGVAAYVHARVDGDPIAHAALIGKLRVLGAKVSSRICKETTHVIFSRKLQPSAQERAVEDADLKAIYEKVSKVREQCGQQPCCGQHGSLQ